MKKILLAAVITRAYAPLTSATSVSKGFLWNGDTTFTIPLGFNFKMAGTTISKIYFSGGNFIAGTINSAKQSGFIMLGAGLMDRGAITGTSKSDIRYTSTGTTGSRVFKLEVLNAGFEDEYFNNGELKDSISLQFWLFEGSNIVEFHYGSSMVSNFSDYFDPALRSGYMQNLDTATFQFDKFYVVNGSARNPALDSFTNFSSTKGLNSVPANGSVFRFTPKGSTTGIQHVSAGTLAKVFPTQCNGMLNIEHKGGRPMDFTIMNAKGQVITKGSAPNGLRVIDLSSVPSGVYFIQLMDAANATYETQKFIRL
jgi:hypothetical protein